MFRRVVICAVSLAIGQLVLCNFAVKNTFMGRITDWESWVGIIMSSVATGVAAAALSL